jgi:hypothetical protein
MFLHTPTLKKLLKKAFNSYGLTVANFDEQIYLQGSSWAISLDENHIPNKVKGAIIELCGIIPDDGQVFKATKEGLQYEIPWSDIFNLRDQFRQAKLSLTKTSIVIEKSWHSYALFQLNQNNDISAISTELTNLIDIREINYEVEGMPSGPCCSAQDLSMLLWNNATCTLGLCTCDLKGEKDIEIINLLKKIDFDKED